VATDHTTHAAPNALVCGNDEIAFGVLEALAKEKIDCPGEISIVGLMIRVGPGAWCHH